MPKPNSIFFDYLAAGVGERGRRDRIQLQGCTNPISSKKFNPCY
jgi:hypothetical protein